MYLCVTRAGVLVPRAVGVFLGCFVAVVLAVSMLPGGVAVAQPTAAPAAEDGDADDAESDGSDFDGDGVLDRPDGVSAAVTARVSGRPVEDLSKRSESTQTIVNPDGSLTDEDFGTAVRVQADDGTWEDVDYDLEQLADGSYAPKVSAQDVTVSGGDSKEAARLSFDDGSSLAVSWPGVLPEPRIDGGVATYALSPETDLIVAVTGGGVATRIRVNGPPADDDPVFTLGLRADDLEVDQTATGGLKVTDGEGDQVGTTSTLVAWDAQTDEAGDPVNVVPVDADLTEVSSRGEVTKHELELTAPEGFLSDPDTVYPVIIDPDISAVAHWRDTWVRSGTTTNYGASPSFIVGKQPGSSNTNPAISYSQWKSGQFAGKTVVKATMSLWQYHSGTCADRVMYAHPLTSGFTEASTVYTNRPSVNGSTGDSVTIAKNRGGTGCSPDGYLDMDVTKMVRKWATGGYANYGLQLSVGSASYDSTYSRYLCSSQPDTSHSACNKSSQVPRLKITYNGPPNVAAVPSTTQSRTFDGSLFVSSAEPVWSSSATDAEASQVKYTTEVRPSTGSGTVSATCTTSLVASGATASCSSGTPLANGASFVVRSKATDSYGVVGPWSSWRPITVDTTVPAVPSMTCTGVADKNWYETKPASSTTCSVVGNGADVEFQVNGQTRTALATTATTPQIGLPDVGYTNIKVRSRTRAGAVSAWAQVAFGTGPASLLAPIADDRSSSTFPVEAAAPTGADSAKVQWRFAPETGEPGTWTDATSVKLATNGTTAWDGSVSGDDWSKTPRLVWNPKDETGVASTALVQVRVLFAYDGADKTSPLQQVQVVPHAFGGSFPTDSAGPGQVALFTGEFQMDTTDVDVPGYGGSLSLGRSHLSFANTASGQAGVFGPGWKASIDGPEEGQASLIVLDRTGIDGTFVLNSPDGESYVYRYESGKSDALATGTYAGVGETAMDEDELTLVSTTDAGLTHRLTLTEWDGTRTIWARTTAGVWALEQVIGVEAESTTTFARDTDGYTSWIFAPAPSGVDCDTTSQQPGCRALHLNYTGTGAAKRLSSVDLRIWNPATGANGEPGSGAGMATITVAKYSYDGAGLLTAAWDPRLGDGGSALKTQYDYDTVNGKTVIDTITEPGVKPWHFNHDTTTGTLTSVTRAQDAAVGGADATWTVKYDIGLAASGDGLPNLSADATATWGQPAGDAPVAGAAVWGPERIPASTPSAEDNEYASLSYWTKSGRVTNTATFGAGGWQIDSTRYDDQGNTIWDLDAAGRNQALAEGTTVTETAGAADKYATLTVYNTAGTRVEETYSPTHDFVPDDGKKFTGRTLTQTVYDDEADAGDMPGRPTTGVPAGGFGLAIFEKTSTTDKAGPGAAGTPFDTDTTAYRYNPNTAGDGDGWELRTPTKVITGTGADTSTSTARFDDEGKVFETRTPQSNASSGTAAQARTTHTDYYTAASHPTRAACSNKPAWVGEVCWTGPTGGANVPSFTTAGYSMQLAATKVVEAHDGASRTSITGYDTAGRATTSSVTTSGLTVADRTVASTTTTYSPTTGQLSSVTNGTQTMSTTYDTWGRVLTQTDGNGNTATTSYDTAGRVKTANDGKGTYTYTYNGDDSKGKRERRGMVTKLDVGLASGTPSEFTAAYDDQGALVEQNYPGGMKATTTRDLTGVETALDYTQGGVEIVSFSNTVDADGRVKVANGPDTAQGYTYDSRDRLTKVADQVGGQCTIRTYGFSLDSDRTSLKTYDPDPAADGACQDDTVASSVTADFNDADQLTTGPYAYDKLGRSTTVPAGDTTNTGETPGNLAVGYHANDMVATLSQTATEDGTPVTRGQDFTLDTADRISTIKDLIGSGQVAESVNYYDSGDDSPAWTSTKTRDQAADPWGATTWTRNVTTIGGDLGIIQSSDGTATIQIANLHDDIVATVALDGTGLESYAESTEYGAPRETATDAMPDRYGWLGAKQRQTAGITGGLTLMGARLYNPATGRFLSRDPIPGGNDNTYTYPPDTINMFDLNGLMSTRWNRIKFWGVTTGYKITIRFSRAETLRIKAGGAWVAYGIAANHAFGSSLPDHTRALRVARIGVRRFVYAQLASWYVSIAASRASRKGGKLKLTVRYYFANPAFAVSSFGRWK